MRRIPILTCCRYSLVLSAAVLLPILGAGRAFAQPTPAVPSTQIPPEGAASPTPGGEPAPAVPAEAPPEPPPPPAAAPLIMPPMDTPPPPVMGTPLPPPPPPAPHRELVGSKFSADLYGFVEFDSILDSTQTFNEIAGNAVIAKSSTFTGNHIRTTYSGRNSRLGLKLKGPESEDIKTSALAEMDFLGNQPTGITDAALLTNPTFRIRHMMLKVETPYIDVMAGQYWQLFGWQGSFFPNSVEIMGLPGQVFGRSPQLRLSHPFKNDAVTVEVAVASSRSPQRDGGVPDTQGGIRLLVNHWKAAHTANSTGSAIDSGGIGVSGVYRRFRVNNFSAAPTTTNDKNAGGISVDALLPLVSPEGTDRSNSLTLTGSYVRGTGIADLYTGLTGGIGYPSLPNPTMAATAPTYTPDIDAGLVTYGPAGDLHTIDWQSFIVGAQYYLPPSGSVWISGNYSQMDSGNIDKYTTTATAPKVFKRSQFADGNLFWDATKTVRFGAEFAWFKQKFVDDSTATNYRGQFSAFYIF
jgi:hypothetical protein